MYPHRYPAHCACRLPCPPLHLLPGAGITAAELTRRSSRLRPDPAPNFLAGSQGFSESRDARGLPWVPAAYLTPALVADGYYFEIHGSSGFDQVPMHPSRDEMDEAARYLEAHSARFPGLQLALGRYGEPFNPLLVALDTRT